MTYIHVDRNCQKKLVNSEFTLARKVWCGKHQNFSGCTFMQNITDLIPTWSDILRVSLQYLCVVTPCYRDLDISSRFPTTKISRTAFFQLSFLFLCRSRRNRRIKKYQWNCVCCRFSRLIMSGVRCSLSAGKLVLAVRTSKVQHGKLI